jgi:hypothetical protein
LWLFNDLFYQALHYALKVPEDSELLYQYAFTEEELEELLTDETAAPTAQTEDLYMDSARKTIDGEECAICKFGPRSKHSHT